MRLATEDEVDVLARLHAIALPDSGLAALGEPTLRLLYRRLIRDPDSVVLVTTSPTVSGSRVTGFVAGTTDVGALMRRFVLRDGARVVLTSPGAVLRRAAASWETLRYPNRTGAEATGPVTLPPAELLSIAVDPGARGRGAGAELVGALLEWARARGAVPVKVTVASDNATARALYLRCGFVEAATLAVHRGRDSTVLVAR